jgi:hypothetical protein
MNVTKTAASAERIFPHKPLLILGWDAREDILAMAPGNTRIDYPGLEHDVYVHVQNNDITISKPNVTDHILIRKNGNNVQVHKEARVEKEGAEVPQDEEILISRTGNQIRIDWLNSKENVFITRQGSDVFYDRPGIQDDARIISTAGNSVPFPLFIYMDGEVVEQC